MLNNSTERQSAKSRNYYGKLQNHPASATNEFQEIKVKDSQETYQPIKIYSPYLGLALNKLLGEKKLSHP